MRGMLSVRDVMDIPSLILDIRSRDLIRVLWETEGVIIVHQLRWQSGKCRMLVKVSICVDINSQNWYGGEDQADNVRLTLLDEGKYQTSMMPLSSPHSFSQSRTLDCKQRDQR